MFFMASFLASKSTPSLSSRDRSLSSCACRPGSPSRGERSSSTWSTWFLIGKRQLASALNFGKMVIITLRHLSLSSCVSASSIWDAASGGRDTESRTRLRSASRFRRRFPKFPRPPSPPGREGTPLASLCRVALSVCLLASRLKKQEGHVSQDGNESQRPRPHESQRGPVTPGRHKHAPVCPSQTSGRVPSVSHAHAAGTTKHNFKGPFRHIS